MKNILEEIVKDGEERSAHRIILQCNKKPSFVTDNGTIESRRYGYLSEETISTLISNIFPQEDELQLYKRQKRKLNLIGSKNVDVFGLSDLKQLNIYFLPRGTLLYNLDLATFFPNDAVLNAQKQEEKKEKEKQQKAEIEEDSSEHYLNTDDIFIDPTKSKPIPTQKSSDNSNEGQENNSISEAKATDSIDETSTDEADNGSEKLSLGSDASSVNEETNKKKAPIGLVYDSSSNNAKEEESTPSTEKQETPKKSFDFIKLKKTSNTTDTDTKTTKDSSWDDGLDTHTQVGALIQPKPSSTKPVKEKAKVAANVSSTPKTSPAANNKQASEGVTNKIDDIFRKMLRIEASDLHMSADSFLTFRVNGDLRTINEMGKYSSEKLSTLFREITPQSASEALANNGHTAFVHEISGVSRFRISLFHDYSGMNAAVRYLPLKIKSCDNLHLPLVVKKLCYFSKGLVILTGYAGSGRSSTLASLADLINKTKRCNLLTVDERATEYIHKQEKSLIRQQEVGKHVDSVASALHLSMQRDVDTICIDGDTWHHPKNIKAVLDNVEAGRLVIATMRGKTGISSLQNIIRTLPQAHLTKVLSESLRAVVSQTLMQAVNGSAVSAFEVIIMGDTAIKLIQENKLQMLTQYMQTNKAKGNILFNDSLINLIARGIITPRTAFAAAPDKKSFYSLATQQGIKIAA